MSDVFISYSSVQKDFGHKLHSALKEQTRPDGKKLEIWMDWQDIPVTSGWWAQIKKGIEESDNFVFISTTESMGSPICQLEIEHARSLSKRIIVLEHLKPDDDKLLGMAIRRSRDAGIKTLLDGRNIQDIVEDNRTALNLIHTFYFSPDDDFESKVKELTDAILLDLLHVQVHTDLQQQALKWDRRDKVSTSYLLSGEQLLEAEEWLKTAEQEQKNPSPSPLHIQFIQASRKEENERIRIAKQQKHRTTQLRQATILAIIVGIVAAIVGGISYISSINSQEGANSSNTQVANANQELTSIPPTLTVVNEQAATIQQKANYANTQVFSAHNELTLIPLTLDTSNTQVAAIEATGTQIAQSSMLLNYANHANRLILSDTGNAETAALLSLYSLNIDYSPEADYLLAKSLDRLSTTNLFAPDSGGGGVAISSTGHYALIADTEGMTLWDIIKDTEVLRFESGDTFCVDFSQNNELALSCGGAGVILWNTQTGEKIQEFSPDEAVFNATFSPDSQHILIGNNDGIARLWDIESNSVVQTFVGNYPTIYDLTFSRDGTKLSISYWNSSTIIWDVETGEEINRFSWVGSALSSDISPSGDLLVVSYGNDTVRLYNIATGRRIRDFVGHSLRSMEAKFVSNSQLVTASTDGTARLWDVETGELIRVFSGHTDGIYGMDVNRSTLITNSIDDSVRIWNLQGISWQEIIRGISADTTGGVHSAFFSPDGRYIITASWSPELWDVQTNKQIIWYPFGDVSTVNFSSHGRRIVAGNGPFKDQNPSDVNTIQTFNTLTGELIQTFRGHTGRIIEVLFSHNNHYIVSASWDNTVRLWDARTGEQLKLFEDHTDRVNSVVFSPDELYLASGSSDKTVRIWNIETEEQSMILNGHTDFVNSVAYSPDGLYLASGGRDMSIIIWNTQTGEQIRTLLGHTDIVGTIIFSPNGNYILSSSHDNTARLWDVETGEILRVYQGHTGAVNSASFSSDGQYVLTAGDDGTLRIWYTEWQDFADYACTRIFRDFTEEERSLYGISSGQPTCPNLAPPPTLSEISLATSNVLALNSRATLTAEALILTASNTPTITPSVTPTARE